MKILLVDDEISLLEATKTYLQTLNQSYQITTATSAIDGLQALREEIFDIIISDYQMPEMNGLDFLKKIREMGNEKPFILFTGRGREEVAIKALNLGASYYLKKGGDPKSQFWELINLIEKSISKIRIEKQLSEKEKKYRELFEKTFYGYANYQILFDDHRKPCKAILLEANKAFERITGYNRDELIGKEIDSLFPGVYIDDPNILEKIDWILNNNEPITFEQKIPGLNSWYLFTAYSLKENQIVLMFTDITVRKNAEALAINSLHRFRLIFNMASDAMILHEITEDNLPGKILNANDRACKLFGYTREELLKLTPKELSLTNDEQWREAIELLEQKKTKIFETKNITKTGKKIAVEINSQLFEIDGKKTILSVIRDISNRKKTQEGLIQREKYFRLLFNKAPLAYQSLDGKGTIIAVNQAWLELLGYPRKEVIGKCFCNFLSPKEKQLFHSRFQKFKDNGKVNNIDYKMVKANGEVIDVIFNGKIAYDADGKFIQTHCILTEITNRLKIGKKVKGYQEKLKELVESRTAELKATNQKLIKEIKERKKIEQELRNREEKYRLLFNLGNDAVFVHGITEDGLPGRFIELNKRAVQHYGYSYEEFLTLSPFDLDTKKFKDQIPSIMIELFEQGRVLFETEHLTKAGRKIPVEINSELFYLDEKPFVLSMVRDISLRKKTEKKLKEKTQELARQLRVRDWRYAVSQMTTKYDISLDEFFNQIISNYQQLWDQPERVNIRITIYSKEYTTDNFTKTSNRLATNIIVNNQKAGIIEFYYQQSFDSLSDPFLQEEQDRLETIALELGKYLERRKIEERVRFQSSLLDQVRNAVIVTDLDGSIIYWNKYAEKLYQWTREEAMGNKLVELITPQRMLEPAEQVLDFIRREGFWQGEFECQKKDGTIIPVSVRNAVVRNQEGEIIGMVGVSTDVSERKKNEAKLLKQKKRLLRQRDELESFATTIAHDLRGKLQLISFYNALDNEGGKYKIEKEIKNISHFLENLLLLAKKGKILGELEEIDLNQLIEETLRKILVDSAEIEYKIKALPVITADRLKIKQVFENIFRNIIDHAGASTIDIFSTEDDQFQNIKIKDDGKGIPVKRQEEIIDSLVTQKYSSFGLTIIIKILQAHGASLTIKSGKNLGTEFTIHFPKDRT